MLWATPGPGGTASAAGLWRKPVALGGTQVHSEETAAVPAAAGGPHIKRAPAAGLLTVCRRIPSSLSDSIQSFQGWVAMRWEGPRCWQVRNTALL